MSVPERHLCQIRAVCRGADRPTVLAEQDRQVRFLRIADADDTERFAIEVLDSQGAVAESLSFAHEAFPDAATDYTRRVVEMSGFLVAEVAFQVATGMRSLDHEAVASVLHEDFVQIDFRPLGYPDLDKSGFLSALDAQSDVVRVWLTETMHAATSDVVVVTGSFWTLHYGRWASLNRAVYLDVLKDGQFARMEMYPDEQLNSALARFGELTLTHGPDK